MRWRRVKLGTLAACAALGGGCINATVSDVVRTHAALAGGGGASVGGPEPASGDAHVVGAEGTAPQARAVPTETGSTRVEKTAADVSRPPGAPAAPEAPPVLGARGLRGRDDPSSRTPTIAPANDDAQDSGAGRAPRRGTRPVRREAKTPVLQILGVPWWTVGAALLVGCVLGLVVARRRSRRALLALRRRSDGGRAWRAFRTRLDAP